MDYSPSPSRKFTFMMSLIGDSGGLKLAKCTCKYEIRFIDCSQMIFAKFILNIILSPSH